MPEVILYTRANCHLCEVAKQTLARHGLCIREVDIDLDDRLRTLYTDWVPVVEIDGQVRFKGRVDERLLRRLFAASRE